MTQGEAWPPATLQAFAETPELDLLFIMGDTAEKFQNLLRRPKVTVIVDTRDVGDVNKFQVSRSVLQGSCQGSRVGLDEGPVSEEKPFRGAVLRKPGTAHGTGEAPTHFVYRA